MGEKKGKKDRAKEHRQTEARHAKAEKKKNDRQQSPTLGRDPVSRLAESHRGRS